MIGRLTGRILDEDPDGTLIVDVAGVGYEVLAPLGTRGRAQPDPEGASTLFVHTLAREDALLLYGFAAREDRAVFRALIGVSNVGPKIALAVLSAMEAADLASAVVRGDGSRLTKVPGIGKKTAERLMLELKDKLLAPLPDQGSKPPAAVAAHPDGKAALLHGALTRMGYRPSEAERALVALGQPRVDDAPLDVLVREALAVLST